MAKAQREKWIDFVKFIAILIVMMNHSRLDIPGVKFWGGMFFVPVFFVLSGFTHKSREESFAAFLGRKAKRLLLPYITANGILFVFFVIKDVVLGSVAWTEKIPDIIGIFYARNQLFADGAQTLFLTETKENVYFYRMLNSPTWFLPALFLTMVLFELLLRFFKNDIRKTGLAGVILLCVANLYHYLCPILLPWSLDALPYFFLMFLWGYIMTQKNLMDAFDRRKRILLIVFVVFVAAAMINGSANYSIGDYGKSTTLALFNAVSSSTLLMYLIRKSERYIPRVLTVAGQYTLFMLCYHLFFFSLFETIFAGIHPLLTIFVTLVLLTVFAWGKEKVLYAKK